MYFEDIILPSFLAPGGQTSYVPLPVNENPTLLRLTSTQVGIPVSTAIFVITNNRGASVVPNQTISGTGRLLVSVPPSTSVLSVGVTCTAGQCRVAVETGVGDVDVLGNVSADGMTSAFQVVTVTAADTTVDLSLGQNIHLLLQASTTLTLTNPTDGTRYLFRIKQQGVGGYTVAFPSLNWRATTAPTITPLLGSVDYVTLVYTSLEGEFDGAYDQNFG